MVPFGLSAEQFAVRYRQCLNRSSKEFIDKLGEFFKLAVPETVIEAEVQVFLGEDGMETPSAWIYFQGRNNKVDSHDPAIFPGKSMELPLDLTAMEEFAEEYYNDDMFDGVNIIANTVKHWLAECWWKAGGWRYKVPVKLWVHDGFGDGKPVELSAHE